MLTQDLIVSSCFLSGIIDKNDLYAYIEYENDNRFHIIESEWDMDCRSKYNTKQGELILTCLKKHREEHVTAEKVLEYLKAQGTSVGQTTIYRNLDKLVNEGIVIKYTGAEGQGACYQYIEHADSCATHYHLICADCGRMIHLQCEYLDEMTAHLLEHHQFSMDKFKTVIYGLCRQCEAAKLKKNDGEI